MYIGRGRQKNLHKPKKNTIENDTDVNSMQKISNKN